MSNSTGQEIRLEKLTKPVNEFFRFSEQEAGSIPAVGSDSKYLT